MDGKLLLQVDPRLTFSVNTQLKEQLKWLIGLGQIRPGDRLPAANQLADRLGVNRNTVQWVYTQLRDEGIVTIQKGRGTQVAQGQAVARLREQRTAMRGLLTQTIEEAAAHDLEGGDLFTAALAYTLLQGPQAAKRLRLLFVECREHDHPFYRSEIERITGGEVRTVFLDELRADSGVRDALAFSDRVVTTLNHADEVKVLLGASEARIAAIGASADTAVLLEIARLAPDTKVAFVCLGLSGGQWMAERVRSAGIGQIDVEPLGLDREAELADGIRLADRVYASAAAWPAVQAMAPGKAALYPMSLEKSSERLLAELADSRR